jgi:cytoskeletal protein RodZ
LRIDETNEVGKSDLCLSSDLQLNILERLTSETPMKTSVLFLITALIGIAFFTSCAEKKETTVTSTTAAATTKASPSPSPRKKKAATKKKAAETEASPSESPSPAPTP